MDFDQELPQSLPASNTLRRVQVFDLLGQVACFLLIDHLSFYTGSGRRSFDPDSGLVVMLGGWQFLSALLHIAVWKKIPGSKRGRRLHLTVAGVVGVVLALAFSGGEADNTLWELVGVLYLSPVLACLYFCITTLDLWKLSAATCFDEAVRPTETGQRVIPQAFCLLVILAMLFRSSLFGGITGYYHSVGFYIILPGFTAWLVIDYVKARRLGQVSLMETVCLVWAGFLLVFELAVLLFRSQITLPAFWVSLFFSPALVLALWYTASLWRGPLWMPLETDVINNVPEE